MNLLLAASSSLDGSLLGGLLALVFLGVGLISFALWIWMLIDCIKNEPSEGNDKLIWIIVIVLAGALGALIYLFARRPTRKRQYGR